MCEGRSVKWPKHSMGCMEEEQDRLTSQAKSHAMLEIQAKGRLNHGPPWRIPTRFCLEHVNNFLKYDKLFSNRLPYCSAFAKTVLTAHAFFKNVPSWKYCSCVATKMFAHIVINVHVLPKKMSTRVTKSSCIFQKCFLAKTLFMCCNKNVHTYCNKCSSVARNVLFFNFPFFCLFFRSFSTYNRLKMIIVLLENMCHVY